MLDTKEHNRAAGEAYLSLLESRTRKDKMDNQLELEKEIKATEKLSTYKQLVTDSTVEFATMLHRLDHANVNSENPDDGFKELKFSVPMQNGKFLHIDLQVNEDKGMVE